MYILHEILNSHIDLECKSHYYAAMRIFIIKLLAIVMLISGCTTHSEVSSRQSRTIIENNVPANPTQAESPKVIQEQQPKQEIANIIPAPPINLFERIRRGFKFPDIDSKYTADYVKWNVNHPTYLTDLFLRAEPFLYYIVEEIDKRGLPMELALLPAIESAFKPQALSRSNAGGLWQFIPSTGRSFGLRQDWWYDARSDLISSTNAALDYLTQLNALFNEDWHLTLAAYNAGQGTVSRAIQSNQRKGKATNYQSLSLRTETIKYIPKLQALKNIVQNPGRYNVSLADIPNQPFFEIISLPGQVDLQQFADLAKLDIQTVKHMNAGFLQWATSPDGPHRLLTPLSNHVQSSMALQQIKTNPSIQYAHHTIARGETLGQIGQRYGVSINALQNTNKLTGTNIRAGKTLIIPVASRIQGSSSSIAAVTGDSTNKRIHRVVKGDTLWSISQRYNVELQKLLSWNELTKNQILRLNQSLLIFLN